MKKTILQLLLFALCIGARAQVSYFPPALGSTWQTASYQDFKYDINYTDSLYAFLDSNNSKGFLVVYDGKIVVEKYFDQFTRDSAWYWASAGKSLSAFLMGVAEEQGLLDIGMPANTYLGNGWTSCTPEQEDSIKVWHLLSMSSGLDDAVPDVDCTDPSCLKYKANPGTRWAYHNGPYHLCHDILEAQSGKSLNAYTTEVLALKTGITGLWLNHVFFSKPRSMARFGLLMLNHGIWNQDTILHNREYFDSMTVSSQAMNPAYGLLWWLNGQSSFMIPQIQLSFNGSLNPSGPADMYAALGKNDQKIYIVPSQKLVIVRVGDDTGTPVLGPSSFDSELWEQINRWRTLPSSASYLPAPSQAIYPNPNAGRFQLKSEQTVHAIYDQQGKRVGFSQEAGNISIDQAAAGFYAVILRDLSGRTSIARVQVY